MFDHQIFQYLKSGHLLPICQAGTWGILGKPVASGFEALMEKIGSSATNPVLLLPELGQLSIYLQQVPEIAWDIMGYSEKVLQVTFSKGKNVPTYFLREEDKIAVRVESKGEFHKMLYNMGSPLMLIEIPSNQKMDFLRQHDKMLNLPHNFEWKLKADKILALEVNGEIRF